MRFFHFVGFAVMTSALCSSAPITTTRTSHQHQARRKEGLHTFEKNAKKHNSVSSKKHLTHEEKTPKGFFQKKWAAVKELFAATHERKAHKKEKVEKKSAGKKSAHTTRRGVKASHDGLGTPSYNRNTQTKTRRIHIHHELGNAAIHTTMPQPATHEDQNATHMHHLSALKPAEQRDMQNISAKISANNTMDGMSKKVEPAPIHRKKPAPSAPWKKEDEGEYFALLHKEEQEAEKGNDELGDDGLKNFLRNPRWDWQWTARHLAKHHFSSNDVLKDFAEGKLIFGHSSYLLLAIIRSIFLSGPQLFATFCNPYAFRDMGIYCDMQPALGRCDAHYNNITLDDKALRKVGSIKNGYPALRSVLMLVGVWQAWSHGLWNSAVALLGSTAFSYFAPRIAGIISPAVKFIAEKIGAPFYDFFESLASHAENIDKIAI